MSKQALQSGKKTLPKLEPKIPFPAPKEHEFTFIDLFAGIGGFRMALNNTGGGCINFSEINKDAIDTYCTNFNESATSNLGDITKIKKLTKPILMK